MSRRIAERAARVAQMFPTLSTLRPWDRVPTKNERAVFKRYRLSKAARLVAVYSSRHSVGAAAIYAAIRRSL